MVSGSFSLPCSGFFSPFPHGTGSLSVSQEYLALADGPAGFTQGFSCPVLLRNSLAFTISYLYWAITVYGSSFQRILVSIAKRIVVLQPQICRNMFGLGFSGFARHYYRNHFCFLFLRLIRCFSSAGLLLCIRRGDKSSSCRVAPFGDLRISLYVPVPAAFRSLSRPSSPLRA